MTLCCVIVCVILLPYYLRFQSWVKTLRSSNILDVTLCIQKCGAAFRDTLSQNVRTFQLRRSSDQSRSCFPKNQEEPPHQKKKQKSAFSVQPCTSSTKMEPRRMFLDRILLLLVSQ